MGAMAGQFSPFIIQDPSEQYIRKRILGVRAAGDCRRSGGMESVRGLYTQFSRHHTARFVTELRDRAAIGQTGSDAGRVAECDVWECCGIDSTIHALPTRWTILMVATGQYCRFDQWRNPHRSVQYAGIHTIEYPLGSWLLLLCRRHQTP